MLSELGEFPPHFLFHLRSFHSLLYTTSPLRTTSLSLQLSSSSLIRYLVHWATSDDDDGHGKGCEEFAA